MGRYKIVNVGTSGEGERLLFDELNNGGLQEWKIIAVIPGNITYESGYKVFLEHISVAHETIKKNPDVVE